jgi:hypothetical protein
MKIMGRIPYEGRLRGLTPSTPFGKEQMGNQTEVVASGPSAAPAGDANPPGNRVRRSDRLPLNLPVQVSGSDSFGQFFMEEGRTDLVSRHGAKILISQALVPEQEILVRCLKTGLESEARVVGQVGKSSAGYFYGIEFLEANLNVWGIEFPPLNESENAVARVLLECGHCHSQELVYLDELEAEVFETNKSLSRLCKRCNDTALWKQAASNPSSHVIAHTSEGDSAPKTSAALTRTQNERKDIRVTLKMVACIRGMQCGEEVVTTENVSRGGIRFKSAKFYAPGSSVEVAVPFAHGTSNIFALAQISNAEFLPSEGLTLYGVAYVRKNFTKAA